MPPEFAGRQREYVELVCNETIPAAARERFADAVDAFCEKCVTGIKANKARCEELVELSMAMVTSLAPKIGYDRAAEIAKESVQTGKTVRQLCLEKKILPEKELERILDPISMTEPGGSGSAGG